MKNAKNKAEIPGLSETEEGGVTDVAEHEMKMETADKAGDSLNTKGHRRTPSSYFKLLSVSFHEC